MRIDNQSTIEDADLREALKFTARGVRDAGLLVRVRMAPQGSKYSCRLRRAVHYRPGGLRSDPASVDWVIELRIAQGEKPLPVWTWYRTRRIRLLYPSPIKLKPKDALVFLTAFCIRQFWQAQRGKRFNTYAADKWGWSRLCDWRVATGRNQIVPLKQTNPFAAWRERQEAETRQREESQLNGMQAGRRLITVEEDEE